MKGDPQKILIIRLSSIGDILLTSPLIRLLRRRFPSAEIDYCVKERYAELLTPHPYLRRLLTLRRDGRWAMFRLRRQIKAENYSLVVDVHRNLRSLLLRDGRAHTVTYPKFRWKRWLLVRLGINRYNGIYPVYQRYLSGLTRWQIQDDGLGLDFFLTDEEKEFSRTWLANQQLGAETRRIGFAIGAGHATKRWPIEYFMDLARLLQARSPVKIFLFGGKQDQPSAAEIVKALGSLAVDLCGQFSLRRSAALLAEMDLMVANDTGLMHLAIALKVKTVAIFGCTTAELGFFPVASFSRVVQHSHLSCRPCSHVGWPHCPRIHFRCMREIAPKQVEAAARSLLS